MEYGYQVLRAVRKIVRRISEHSRAISRDAGLTVPQLLCLKAIGELSPAEADEAEKPEHEITIARVSREVHLSPPTVSRIIDRLERSGMVLRERRSKDRRRVCLSLTEAGRERFRCLPTPLDETFLQRLNALDPDQVGRLLRSLEQVIELMDASAADDAPLLASEL